MQLADDAERRVAAFTAQLTASGVRDVRWSNRSWSSSDMTRVMEPFAEEYFDAEGIDRRGIYGIFWTQFRKRGPITVWLSAIDVTVKGRTATASFDAGLAESTQGQMIGWPINVDALTFVVDLEKGSDWKVTSHTRRPAWELDAAN